MLRKLGKVEILVLSASTAFAMASGGYLLFTSEPIKRFETQGDAFGYLRPLGRDVRLRSQNDSAWNKIEQEANVFRNDRVFTGATSSAEVNLQSKQKLTVQPNSLIVLSEADDSLDLNLKDGGFLGELKKGVKLLVKHNEKVAEIHGDGAVIRLDTHEEKSMKLVVLKGEATVRSAPVSPPPAKEPSSVSNETAIATRPTSETVHAKAPGPEVILVKANSEAKITEEKIEVTPLQIGLVEPAAGATIWEKSSTVEFKWNAVGDQKKNHNFILEVSIDPMFRHDVEQKHLNSSLNEEIKTQVKIPSGNVYFWRVRVAGDKTILSPVSSFSYESLKAPDVKDFSEIETEFNYKNQTAEPYRFAWIDPTASQSYRFEISNDENFKKLVTSEDIIRPEIALSNLKKGTYYWRVTSRHEGRIDLTSKTAQLSLREKPQPISTIISAVVSEPERKIAQAETEEPKKPEAKNVETPAEKKQETMAAPAVPLEAIQQPAKDITPEPVVEARKPKEKPPETIAPLERPSIDKEKYQFVLIEDYSRDAKLPEGFVAAVAPDISWSAVSGADEYEVEISSYEDFHETIVKEEVKSINMTSQGKSEKIQWQWKKPKVGQFYIRISAIRMSSGFSLNEVTLSSPSKFRSVLSPPLLNKVHKGENLNSNPEIQLSWKDHHISQRTEVQISKYEKFSQPQSVKVTGNSYKFLANEPGKYFARLRSLNANELPLSQYSNVEEFKVESWIPPEPPKHAEAPIEQLPPQKPEVQEPPAPVKNAVPFSRKNVFSIWGGVGTDYLSFKQASTADTETGDFASMTAPTTSVGANVRLTDSSSLEYQYHDWSGEIEKKGTTAIDKGNFHWKSMSLEYQYRLYKSDHFNYGLLLGVQKHQMPFLSTDTDNDVVNVIDNEMTNGSLGVKVNYLFSPEYEYEFLMRYQQLLEGKSLNGYTLKLKPNLMFDGSMGVSRRYQNGFKMGVYWYGQYHDMQYDFTRSGTTNSGTQNFFNSNIEFRFGWEFFGMFTISTFRKRRRKRRS